MKLLPLAWSAVWLAQASAFVAVPTAITHRGASAICSSAEGRVPPSPDELRARAAAIREELKELEANASATRRPNADLVEPRPVREREISRCF